MGWVDSEIQTAAAPLVRESEARNCAFLEVVGTREGGAGFGDGGQGQGGG